MKAWLARPGAQGAALKCKTCENKPVGQVLALALALLVGGSVYLGLAVQDEPPVRYHVYLTYTQLGKPYRKGAQLSVTAQVRDDNFNPIVGARVLIVPDYEYNLGQVVTTGTGGSIITTFNLNYQSGYIAWWAQGGIITRHILEATYLGDGTHRAAKYNTIVMMSSLAVNYRVQVSRVGGGTLTGFETYTDLDTTRVYQVRLLDSSSNPVNGMGYSLGVEVLGPGVYDECFINSPATSCTLHVNPNTFIKGGNEIIFYQHEGDTIGGSIGSYHVQTIWSTTGPYRRMTGLATTAPLRTWWVAGKVGNGCYESSLTYNDTVAGRNVWIGYGAKLGDSYMHFYPGNGKDLNALDNAYDSALSAGTELTIAIWDEDDSSSGALSSATAGKKCVGGSWKNVTVPAGATIVNKLGYPNIGSIDPPTYVQSTWDDKRVYAVSPYSDPDYALTFLDLLDTIRVQYDNSTAASTLKGISIALGGNGEAIPISTSFGNFRAEFGGSCNIEWTTAFQNTLGTIQAGIMAQNWQHIPIYQRNLMSYNGNGLWAIGKVGAGNQNMRSYSLTTSMSMWGSAAALQATENWMGLRYGWRYAPIIFEDGAGSWHGGDNSANDDFSGSFWRNLLWMPLRPSGYGAAHDYQCLYSDTSQTVLAATMNKIITAATQSSEMSADVAYLAFRGMGVWSPTGGEQATGSHEGLYMYSLNSWGNVTTPKYYTDVVQSGASLTHEFHNSVSSVRGATTPTETSGAMLASGHTLSIDVWDSWKWARSDLLVTLAYTIGVMNRTDSDKLLLHFADSGSTTGTVEIDVSAGSNEWAYRTGQITTTLRNALQSGLADFTLEASGGPVWLVVFIIEGKGYATEQPTATSTPTPTLTPAS
jgi:hypothetical protein